MNETIETVTKGDINDLKAYANAIGVKCENCKHFSGGNICELSEKIDPAARNHRVFFTRNGFFCSNYNMKLDRAIPTPKTKD